MDKEWVKEAYRAGQRAYMRNGYNVIGATVFGKMVTYQEVLISDMDIWHALRAYQDEQRKKGVPIVLTKEECEKWHVRSTADVFFTHHRDTMQPQISFYTSDDDAPFTTGPDFRFTNFRWREGYPKHGGMANVKVLGGGVVELLKNNQ